jgi:hypothetical protein
MRNHKLYQAAIASQHITEELLIAYGEQRTEPLVSVSRVRTAHSYLRELAGLLGFKIVENGTDAADEQLIQRAVKRIRKRAYQAPYSHRMLELADEIEALVGKELAQ